MFKRSVMLAVALCLAIINSGVAVASKLSPERLNKDLTPYGAERAGNKSGTIPEWTGGLLTEDIPKSYVRGMHHPDPFEGSKKRFTITAQNMDQYENVLSAGLIKMLKRYPDTFYIPVYPTKRSASAPRWVYDNIYQNAKTAKLINNGNGIKGAYAGVAFPIPLDANGQVNPLKVLWNHITRWRGVFVKRNASEAVVQRNGSFALVTSAQEIDFVYYHKDGNEKQLDNRLLYYISQIKQPARLAGGAILVHDTIDRVRDPRKAWGYNAGQRRLRRAPNLAYDTPVASSDGIITADDVDIFNGAGDRYNWKLLGKKEMIIPYNNYKLDSNAITYEQMLKKGHVNPKFTRYELHRVWVIEGTLKDNQRHIYTKRTFYIDEDSWTIAMADQYDSQGELWRVSLSFLKNYYEVPVLWTALDVYHDLSSQRYYVAFLDNEEKTSLEFDDISPPSKYFKPAQLRRRSRR
ncbi:MAG: DUF1329 domain-containing protein [Pseudomonadales bacterium]|nr:DUF1329 domain-containing protein [Pseudomonadales bacterium]